MTIFNDDLNKPSDDSVLILENKPGIYSL